MTYSLVRTRDGAGDSGPMSQIRYIDEKGGYVSVSGRPKVGATVCVGTYGSRSYASQDYWTTTPVTEILEDTENLVRFKTSNSEYVWKIL